MVVGFEEEAIVVVVQVAVSWAVGLSAAVGSLETCAVGPEVLGWVAVAEGEAMGLVVVGLAVDAVAVSRTLRRAAGRAGDGQAPHLGSTPDKRHTCT